MDAPIIITDRTVSAENEILLSTLIPSPTTLQSIHRRWSEIGLEQTRLINDVDSVEYLFSASITRFGLQTYKFCYYKGIVENAIKLCSASGVNQIILSFHKSNRPLLMLLKAELRANNFQVVSVENSSKDFNSLLSQSSYSNQIKIWIRAVLFALTIVFMSLFKKSSTAFSGVIWMSKANNRDIIDRVIIESLCADNVPIKDVVIDGLDSMNRPFQCMAQKLKFRAVLEILTISKRKFNQLISQYGISGIGTVPLGEIKLFLLHQLVYSRIVHDNPSAKFVFRGANASGMFAAAQMKRNITLFSHGTEFNPVDSIIVNYVSKNLLPSSIIVSNWKRCEWFTNSQSLQVTGRPYYQILKESVDENRKNNKPLGVGIVLTYDSQESVESFIDDISSSFPEDSLIIIKPRSNFHSDLSKYANSERFIIHYGDFTSFLSRVEMLFAGVSAYGVLGMTVMDAVYCGIPAGYYLPRKIDRNSLGYSYTSSMNSICFDSKEQLKNAVGNDVKLFGESLLSSASQLRCELGSSSNSIQKVREVLIQS